MFFMSVPARFFFPVGKQFVFVFVCLTDRGAFPCWINHQRVARRNWRSPQNEYLTPEIWKVAEVTLLPFRRNATQMMSGNNLLSVLQDSALVSLARPEGACHRAEPNCPELPDSCQWKRKQPRS